MTDAFKRDAVMTKVAEDALTAFMDTPLKFGAISTEPKKEEWRLTRVWARLLADHVNAVITSPGSAANEELSDTLDLVALLSNKLAFIQYHKRLLAKRLLNPIKGLEARALELEGFVISRIQAICDGGLVSGCTSLLADHEASRQFSEELSKSKELEKGLQGGALGAVDVASDVLGAAFGDEVVGGGAFGEEGGIDPGGRRGVVFAGGAGLGALDLAI